MNFPTKYHRNGQRAERGCGVTESCTLIELRPSALEYSDSTGDDTDESYKKTANGARHPFT
jgi:hypothetical protein